MEWASRDFLHFEVESHVTLPILVELESHVTLPILVELESHVTTPTRWLRFGGV